MLSAFRAGQPDLHHFPYDVWARLVARRARQSLTEVAGYQCAEGYLPLREAIAAQIGITRGVYCSPQQVVITSGSRVRSTWRPECCLIQAMLSGPRIPAI